MSWITKNTIIYQIFIDRFARSSKDIRGSSPGEESTPNFCGGNLRGIIERFDHLKKLGITTIWISPFYKGVSFHGYHSTDFYEIDERFGSEEDLRELIDLVHKNGMKIIADFVPNHVSNMHPYFLDAQSNPKSVYRNWFYFTSWPNKYLCFLDVDILPKLNLENKDTRDHVINAARKWLSFGLDGYRLDHIVGPSDSFWKIFFETLSKDFPDAEFIGEAWLEGVKLKHLKTLFISNAFLLWLGGTYQAIKHYRGKFPKLWLLDFNCTSLLVKYAKGIFSASTLHKKLAPWIEGKKEKSILFLDNHDMNRFMYESNNNLETFKRAVEIQFSLPYPVIIYQGSEFGMTHSKSKDFYTSYGDLVARKMVPWHEGKGELFDFYKKVIEAKVQDK